MTGSNLNPQSGGDEPRRVSGFAGLPAEININVNIPNRSPVTTVNVPVSEVVFQMQNANIDVILEILSRIEGYLLNEDKEKERAMRLARWIGNELVGESYLRWESRVQYYPTVVFLFLEDEKGFAERSGSKADCIQRKTQCKLRVPSIEMLNKAMDDEALEARIEQLRARVNAVSTLNYKAGSRGFNYVSPGRVKWKTSVFAKAKGDACSLLRSLCSVIEDPFVESQLSSTTGRGSKSNKGLAQVEVSLHKVVLLIQGKPPTELYHK